MPYYVSGDDKKNVVEGNAAGTMMKLNDLSAPTAPVQFSQKQALQFVIENRTSDPPNPVVGQIWFRTDL